MINYEKIQGTLVSGSPNTRVKLADIKLNEDNGSVVGIAFAHTEGLDQNFDLEISDNDKVYHPLVSKDLLVAGSASGPAEKYLPIDFPITSKQINIYINPHELTTADITVQVVFKEVKL